MRETSDIIKDLEINEFCLNAHYYVMRKALEEMASGLTIANAAGADTKEVAEKELSFISTFFKVADGEILNIVPVRDFMKSDPLLSRLLNEEIETKLQRRVLSWSTGDQLWQEAQKKLEELDKKLSEQATKFSTSESFHLKTAVKALKEAGLPGLDGSGKQPGED